MCGIAGILAPSETARPRPGRIQRLAAGLIHRGPDGEGFYDDGPVALGHRRLAIIDLSPEAGQPMTNEDGRIAIVVNGEIYNHQALRRELEGKGHRFRSHSDSEVVAHLYEEEGSRTPERLRGMFALAVWDRRTGKLLLARDRCGEKPLYYAFGSGGLLFASELGALLADEGIAAEIDPVALDAYLALQYVPSPLSIFRGIHKLPAGHLVEVRCGEEPVPRAYHRLDFSPRADLDEAEAVRLVRTTVEDAVRMRLMSDVPLGAFLSGGLDSSIVVACIARAGGGPVKTFSIGFPEQDASELPWARQVALRWGTEHHELVVAPDMIGVLPSIVRHHGEPFGDPSAVPTRYLCEMTRRHVTVALSGDGGDEAFGGYRRYVWAHVADLIGRLPAPLRAATAGTLGLLPGGTARWVREYGATLATDEASRYLRFVCHFSAAEKAALYTPELAARFAVDATAARFAAVLGASRAGDLVGRLSDLDVQTYLPDDILTKVDVASMTFGLEARAPLVDQEVMALAASLRGPLKLRGLRGKHVLRRAFADLVPPGILGRRKKGFSLPLRSWFAGALAAHARDTLLSDRARQRGLFRPEAVLALLDRHQRGEDHGDRLWNLLALETWFREMVDGRPAFVAEVAARAQRAVGRAEPAATGSAP